MFTRLPRHPGRRRRQAGRRVLSVAVLAMLAGLLLAGCGTTAVTASSSTSTQPTATATATATPPAPTATATATATAAPTAPPATYPVLVYFSKGQASLDDPNAVFPVRRVSPTLAVVTFTMEQLIAGPTAAEKTAGYFTELTTVLHRGEPSSCDGADFRLTLDHRGDKPELGTATLRFCRPTTSPGIGADARITAEIKRTLTQFATISKVVILNRQGDCFGDLSGMNRCLR